MKQRASLTALPFLDEQALLNALWPELDRFVNVYTEPEQPVSPDDPSTDPNVGRLATDAEQLGDGERTDLRLLLDKGMRGAPLPELAPRVPLRLGRRGWILERFESLSSQEKFERHQFTVALVLRPALRPLLRKCDRCRRFFIRARADRRPHSFCSPGCRTAFHRALRQPEAHAASMRKYRQDKARQRALQARREKSK